VSHTPEPWRAEWQPGQTPNHTYTHCVMCGDDSLCDTLTKADAYRIVACVNALAGVADPAAQVAKWRADAERYRKLRSIMYLEGACDIEESVLQWRVIGACPTTDQWDAAIDARNAAKGGE